MRILTLYSVPLSSMGKKNAEKYMFALSPLCGSGIFLSSASLPQSNLSDALNSGYLSQILILCFLKGFWI